MDIINQEKLEKKLEKIYNRQSSKGWHFNTEKISNIKEKTKLHISYIKGTLNINNNSYFYIKPINKTNNAGIFFGRYKNNNDNNNDNNDNNNSISNYYCILPFINSSNNLEYILVPSKDINNSGYFDENLQLLLNNNICIIQGPYKGKPPI